MKKTFPTRWTLFATLLAVAALAGVAPATALGDGPTGQIIDVQTGRCLDSNVHGDVYALSCNGGNYQNWREASDGEFVDGQTGRCLDSNGNGDVYTLPCNGGLYQKWWGTRSGALTDAATGRALDSNYAGRVYALDPNGGSYQNWRETGNLLPVIETFPQENLRTNRCLDSNFTGSVYTNPCWNGDLYQDWGLAQAGTDTYYFIDAQTGRCLDSNASGSVYTWPCQVGDTHEQWFSPGVPLGGFVQDVATGRALTAGSAISTTALSSNDGTVTDDDFQNWFA